MVAKFRLGETVRYMQPTFTGWSSNPEHLKEWRDSTIAEYSKYIGNRGRIVKCESRGDSYIYAIDSIDPLPFHAWYDEDNLQGMES